MRLKVLLLLISLKKINVLYNFRIIQCFFFSESKILKCINAQEQVYDQICRLIVIFHEKSEKIKERLEKKHHFRHYFFFTIRYLESHICFTLRL